MIIGTLLSFAITAKEAREMASMNEEDIKISEAAADLLFIDAHELKRYEKCFITLVDVLQTVFSFKMEGHIITLQRDSCIYLCLPLLSYEVVKIGQKGLSSFFSALSKFQHK